MFKLKKLNAAGFAHHAILMLLVVVSVAGFGAYQVSKSNANSLSTTGGTTSTTSGTSTTTTSQQVATLDCSSLKRNNSQGGTACGTCWAAFTDLTPNTFGDVCVRIPDCSGNNEFYQASTNTCKCNAGYVRGTDGFCHVITATPPPVDPGGVTPPPPTDAPLDCSILKRNNSQAGTACGTCWDAFTDLTPSTVSDICVRKAVCTGAQQFWQSTTNTCKCNAGYYMGGDNTCHILGGTITPTYVTDGAGGTSTTPTTTTITTGSGGTGTGGTGTGTGSTSPTTEALCTNLHRVFTNGQCTEACKAGFTKLGSLCVARSETKTCNGFELPNGKCVPADKVKDYCAAHFLKFDKGKTACGDCIKGYTLADGECVKQGGDVIEPPQVIDLDVDLSKKICEILGRQWENSAKDETGTKIKGCSTNACDKSNVAMVTQTAGVPYCKGYISSIDKNVCVNDLHRVWVAEADGCRENPADKDAGTRVVDAAECDSEHRVYVYSSTTGKDFCLTKGVTDQLTSMAQTGAKPFAVLAHGVKSATCNVNPSKHWNGKKCVMDLPAQDGGSAGTVGNGDGQGTPPPTSDGQVQCGGPVGLHTAPCPYLTPAQCISLNRVPVSGTNPCGDCKPTFTPGPQQGVYDACVERPLSTPTGGSDTDPTATTNNQYCLPAATPYVAKCYDRGQTYAVECPVYSAAFSTSILCQNSLKACPAGSGGGAYHVAAAKHTVPGTPGIAFTSMYCAYVPPQTTQG